MREFVVVLHFFYNFCCNYWWHPQLELGRLSPDLNLQSPKPQLQPFVQQWLRNAAEFSTDLPFLPWNPPFRSQNSELPRRRFQNPPSLQNPTPHLFATSFFPGRPHDCSIMISIRNLLCNFFLNFNLFQFHFTHCW